MILHSLQLRGTLRGVGTKDGPKTTCGRRKYHRTCQQLLLSKLRRALTTSKCKTHGGHHGHATNSHLTLGSRKLQMKRPSLPHPKPECREPVRSSDLPLSPTAEKTIHPPGLRSGGLAAPSASSSVAMPQLGPVPVPAISRQCAMDIFEDFSTDGSNRNDEIADAGLWEQTALRQCHMAYKGSAVPAFLPLSPKAVWGSTALLSARTQAASDLLSEQTRLSILCWNPGAQAWLPWSQRRPYCRALARCATASIH